MGPRVEHRAETGLTRKVKGEISHVGNFCFSPNSVLTHGRAPSVPMSSPRHGCFFPSWARRDAFPFQLKTKDTQIFLYLHILVWGAK